MTEAIIDIQKELEEKENTNLDKIMTKSQKINNIKSYLIDDNSSDNEEEIGVFMTKKGYMEKDEIVPSYIIQLENGTFIYVYKKITG